MLHLPEKYCNSFQQKNYIVDIIANIIAKTWNELSWKELNWVNGKVHLNWIVNLQLGFSQLNKNFFNIVPKRYHLTGRSELSREIQRMWEGDKKTHVILEDCHLMTKSFKHTIRDVNVEVQELSVLHKYRGHRDVSETKLPLFYFFIPQLIVLHFLLTPLPPRIRVLHSTPTQSWQTWRRSGLSLLVFSSVR